MIVPRSNIGDVMSFFEKVELLPVDPILSLPIIFGEDPRKDKVNLGIGAYKDSEGKSMVLVAVQQAESAMAQKALGKDYSPIDGSPDFVEESLKLTFGAGCAQLKSGEIYGAQTLGGTGALRVGAEFFLHNLSKTIYVSNPTWPNHNIILSRTGLKVETFPYYDMNKQQLDMPALCAAIMKMTPGSVILLQACCHNPSGMDPTVDQWKEISALVKKQRLFPFFDFAYQGFAQGVDEDARPIRLFVEEGHELAVASSYSKNFGLYGERVGAISFVAKDKESIQKVGSQIRQIIRGNYSNPPLHGARIVSTILKTPTLRAGWLEELGSMRDRIAEMREALISGLQVKANHHDFTFLSKQKGIFSFCGLNPDQVQRLRKDKGIYIPSNGRINVAGLNPHNLDYVIDAIVSVLHANSVS